MVASVGLDRVAVASYAAVEGDSKTPRWEIPIELKNFYPVLENAFNFLNKMEKLVEAASTESQSV